MSVIVRLPPKGDVPPEVVRKVAEAVRACKIVAFPTDTVYGLGTTGLVKAAARKIYALKGRDAAKPLPILVHSVEAAKKWVEWTPAAEALARRFWPGALTMVLRPTLEGRLLTFPEFETVALRAPNQPALLKIIEASGVPWASTSANASGFPALKDGEAVIKQFTGLADFIIDAGKAPGTESTVVDATQFPVRILRQGALSADDVLAAVRQSVP